MDEKQTQTTALRRLWIKLWRKAHPERVEQAAKRKALYKTPSTWYDEPKERGK